MRKIPGIDEKQIKTRGSIILRKEQNFVWKAIFQKQKRRKRHGNQDQDIWERLQNGLMTGNMDLLNVLVTEKVISHMLHN